MNIGDSRAILFSTEIIREDIKNLSIDHKPELKSEKERIKNYGGYVDKCKYEEGEKDHLFRVWRIQK